MRNIVSITARSRTGYKPMLLLSLLLSLLASGCKAPPPPPPPTIIPSPPCALSPGEKIPLSLSNAQADVDYQWSASAGAVTPPTGSTVTYTAPNTPGQVIITVIAKKGDTSSSGSITCNVEATPTPLPAPTDTPPPTDMPTPTPVPEPVACNHPSVTKEIFPQFEQINNQFSFYGLLNDPNFTCQKVYDIFHGGLASVRIEYHNVGTNYGFWGVGTDSKDTSSYDASGFNEICFWAYAEQPSQAFRLKMKDKRRKEDGLKIIVDPPGKWNQLCTPLSEFSDLGIDVSRLENVNLGFEQPTGSATVWVDDFEFKK